MASVDPAGDPADAGSYNPDISGDGGTIVYESSADNLAEPAEAFAFYSIYAYKREGEEIDVKRISDPEAGSAYTPAVNRTGDAVAYTVEAYREHPEDTSLSRFLPDFYLYAAGAGQGGGDTRTLLNAEPDWGWDSGVYPAPAISADGTRVVFASSADQLGDGAAGVKSNVYLFDATRAEQDALQLVSRGAGGASNGDSYEPDISPDGRHVGFVSDASNLRAGLVKKFTYNPAVLYYADVETGGLTNLGGLQSAAYGRHPALSNGGFAYTETSAVAVALSPSDAPAWPAGKSLNASETAGGLVLNWSGATPAGAVRYKIYQIQANPLLGSYYTIESLIGSTADTTYTVAQLPADKTKLSYRVEAVNGAYQTSANGPAYEYGIDAGEDVSPPSWPSGAAGEQTARTANGVTLAWPAAADNRAVTGYRVYASEPGAPGAVYAETAATTYAADGLTPDTDYVYYVTAVDAAGNESAALPPIPARTAASGDPAGGELSAAAQQDGNVVLTWQAGGSAERYAVLDETDGSAPRAIGETDGDTTSFTVRGAEARHDIQIPGRGLCRRRRRVRDAPAHRDDAGPRGRLRLDETHGRLWRRGPDRRYRDDPSVRPTGPCKRGDSHLCHMGSRGRLGNVSGHAARSDHEYPADRERGPAGLVSRRLHLLGRHRAADEGGGPPDVRGRLADAGRDGLRAAGPQPGRARAYRRFDAEPVGLQGQRRRRGRELRADEGDRRRSESGGADVRQAEGRAAV
ncbi:fibronectin type III domain-containing protein [Cohnella rhizosphaerae]|uniref:Fibronectin type III domain-containing protein n=1 Tax=Cohnella rhizosphaerae TaxID=1457232 RepID=A0A9X4QS89_9BACL|nr:fibronectin type III domain-containing protein [Cohnella rhizosphaerae]MDG0809350.1 fibronectin type III domain-containing protein [Cohnella rhizosphaerae]